MKKEISIKRKIEVKIPETVCANCGKLNSKWRKFCQHCKKQLINGTK